VLLRHFEGLVILLLAICADQVPGAGRALCMVRIWVDGQQAGAVQREIEVPVGASKGRRDVTRRAAMRMNDRHSCLISAWGVRCRMAW
jgi:hypothetical protein